MISRSNTRAALRRKLGRGACSNRLVCARKKGGCQRAVTRDRNWGDPLVFFLFFSFIFFSPSRFSFFFSFFSLYHPFFVYFDIPGREEREREGRWCTGQEDFSTLFKKPFTKSILEEINGRNWSGSGSESCIYTFRPFSLSIQKNVIPFEASRGKQRTQWFPRPIRSDPMRSPRVV